MRVAQQHRPCGLGPATGSHARHRLVLARAVVNPGPPTPTAPAADPTSDAPTPSRRPTIKRLIESHNGVSTTLYRHIDASVDSIDLDDGPSTSSRMDDFVTSVKSRAADIFLPDAYTRDYLPYQLWAVPAHITGWVSKSITTSTLLAAVGVNSPGVAVGATAGIRWITKDGVGSLGRLIVGGRIGRLFDEDPKHLRMLAEFAVSVGLALEVSTSFRPDLFILLAGLGNFAVAVGHSLGRPCFRVIMNHFAEEGNVGSVSAKEEVWELIGQLAGLASSVAVLKGMESMSAQDAVEGVVSTWLGVQALHVWLRYKSIEALSFPTVNRKRACALATQFVAAGAVDDRDEGNRREPILQPVGAVSPRLELGVTLDRLCAFLEPDGPSPAEVGALDPPGRLNEGALAALEVYGDEDFALSWTGGEGVVVLKSGATRQCVLKAVLQAAWLERAGVADAGVEDLKRSLSAASQQWPAFLSALEAGGWDCSPEGVMIDVGSPRLEVVVA